MALSLLSPPEAIPEHGSSMCLSVIIPARNEEDTLESCLRSLLVQSADDFQVGRDWELLLVDDQSTDRTRQIALGLTGVRVLDPRPLELGWTGKANALWTAANLARGDWLLFTDADTIHQRGNLQRAIQEAEESRLALLSYSPRQLVSGFWQRVLMPLIFAELALAYPPAKVSDPLSPVAAANGQFLMVWREAYFAVGGHAAVAGSLLEDVDLACLLKQGRSHIRIRYADDAVSTRMYRGFGPMCQGWTKNLTRLFPGTLALAARRCLELLLLIALPLLAVGSGTPATPAVAWSIWLLVSWRFYARVTRSNFRRADCALSVFGLPLFCLLLFRSWFHHTVKRQVVWKGREYSTLKR